MNQKKECESCRLAGILEKMIALQNNISWRAYKKSVTHQTKVVKATFDYYLN